MVLSGECTESHEANLTYFLFPMLVFVCQFYSRNLQIYYFLVTTWHQQRLSHLEGSFERTHQRFGTGFLPFDFTIPVVIIHRNLSQELYPFALTNNLSVLTIDRDLIENKEESRLARILSRAFIHRRVLLLVVLSIKWFSFSGLRSGKSLPKLLKIFLYTLGRLTFQKTTIQA